MWRKGGARQGKSCRLEPGLPAATDRPAGLVQYYRAESGATIVSRRRGVLHWTAQQKPRHLPGRSELKMMNCPSFRPWHAT